MAAITTNISAYNTNTTSTKAENFNLDIKVSEQHSQN